MIDYGSKARSPWRNSPGAERPVSLTQLTLYPYCMNVTSNPVIYCLEGSVQFFSPSLSLWLPDQIAHFLGKKKRIHFSAEFTQIYFFNAKAVMLIFKHMYVHMFYRSLHNVKVLSCLLVCVLNSRL